MLRSGVDFKFREYGFRPDFCEGHDPESKGVVEALVGYAKSDLVVPGGLAVGELAGANEHARAWCSEVNGRPHTEICAVPAERLGAELPLMGELPSLRPSFAKVASRKVDRLAVVRFGGGRYSVPDKLVGRTVEVQVLGAEVWGCPEIVDTGYAACCLRAKASS